MGEFTPITIESQEQLDGMFKDRLNRQNEKHSKEISELKSQLSDYEALKEEKNGFTAQIEALTSQLNEANEKVKGYDSQIAEKDSQIEAFKIKELKNSIMNEMGLPIDAVNFVQGNDEESIRTNAESLKNLVSAGYHVAPLANHERPIESRSDALMQMVNNLKN